MLYYQDENFYYFRKPAGIPSTFWKEYSFLDMMLAPLQKGDQGGSKIPLNVILSLHAFFWTEKEFWLLNRLDNETSGLLYFAKTPRIYKQFKEMQSALLLSKYYIAEVYGDITPLMKGGQGGSSSKHYIDYEPTLKELAKDLRNNMTQAEYRTSPTSTRNICRKGSSEGGRYQILLPLAHHRYNPDRMVAIKHPNDIKKTKWTLHHLTTEIVEFQFLPTSNTSILLLCIQKWIRHQIRAHLAAIGHPICWDQLYSKSDHKNYDKLQLFSVGLETTN